MPPSGLLLWLLNRPFFTRVLEGMHRAVPTRVPSYLAVTNLPFLAPDHMSVVDQPFT